MTTTKLLQNLGSLVQAGILLDEAESDDVLSQMFVLFGVEGRRGNRAQLVLLMSHLEKRKSKGSSMSSPEFLISSKIAGGSFDTSAIMKYPPSGTYGINPVSDNTAASLSLFPM